MNENFNIINLSVINNINHYVIIMEKILSHPTNPKTTHVSNFLKLYFLIPEFKDRLIDLSNQTNIFLFFNQLNSLSFDLSKKIADELTASDDQDLQNALESQNVQSQIQLRFVCQDNSSLTWKAEEVSGNKDFRIFTNGDKMNLFYTYGIKSYKNSILNGHRICDCVREYILSFYHFNFVDRKNFDAETQINLLPKLFSNLDKLELFFAW
jgi:hypothetical protein